MHPLQEGPYTCVQNDKSWALLWSSIARAEKKTEEHPPSEDPNAFEEHLERHTVWGKEKLFAYYRWLHFSLVCGIWLGFPTPPPPAIFSKYSLRIEIWKVEAKWEF